MRERDGLFLAFQKSWMANLILRTDVVVVEKLGEMDGKSSLFKTTSLWTHPNCNTCGLSSPNENSDPPKNMGFPYPEELTRFPLEVLEMIEKFNVSEACFLPPPRTINLLLQLTWLDLSIFATLTVVTMLSIFIYLDNCWYLMTKVKCPIKRKTLMWMSAAPTVITITSCLGLWVPRAVMFVDMLAATYFGVCFYLLLLVIVQGYGGEEDMLEHLETAEINVSTGPCCCCCPCLPRMRMTRKKYRLFVLGSFQVAFLRPALFFLGIVLWTNDLYDPNDWSSSSVFLWINLFLGVSTILGLWPSNILFRHSKLLQADQNLTCKFSLFQAILILSSLQNSIIGTLAGAGNISCAPPYSARTRGQLINNQLLILEMFLVGVFTWASYRKRDDKPGYRPMAEAQKLIRPVDRACEQEGSAPHSGISDM
ncbi:organic solute transporter subunit alpha-like [Narcine bancroftii]|uniref:organic solute transporter subunit alpha-like n=1 Tax=Narcine bancroftii TaxID=1343680 RepID=UPI003831F1C6